jgi:hypothetical protein
MSKEFPGQDPYLPPGVSSNDPHFGGGYESEIDIDYANEVLGWLEEAEGAIEEAIKILVALGEFNKKMAEKEMEVAGAVSGLRELLKDCIDTEEQKESGEYDEYDADFEYESRRDDELFDR